MGDKLGEAKSSGNLGNTLKVMGKFDEAMICCKRHLEISQELKDKVCMVLSFVFVLWWPECVIL
jgi:G-protein signaling modulator 2